MIDTSKNYFLMIEPNELGSPTEPINDELTEKVKFIYNCTMMPSPGQRYKGYHSFQVGESSDGVHTIEHWISSDNCDHFLPDGTITNSLCVYYVQCFRDYIPEVEIAKINKYYDMCKADPDKRHPGYENSVWKKTKVFKRVIQTLQENKAWHEKWRLKAEEDEKKRTAAEEKAYREDTRSEFFKQALRDAGEYRAPK